MHIGSKNSKHLYTLDNATLTPVAEEKDLDQYRKFSIHCAYNLHPKANSMLGLIKCTFSYMDRKTFLNLYKTMVRPHVEYDSCIWSSYYQKEIEILGTVHRDKQLSCCLVSAIFHIMRDWGNWDFPHCSTDILGMVWFNRLDYCMITITFITMRVAWVWLETIGSLSKTGKTSTMEAQLFYRVVGQCNGLPEYMVNSSFTTLLTPAYWSYNSVYQSLLLNCHQCVYEFLSQFVVHVPWHSRY